MLAGSWQGEMSSQHLRLLLLVLSLCLSSSNLRWMEHKRSWSEPLSLVPVRPEAGEQSVPRGSPSHLGAFPEEKGTPAAHGIITRSPLCHRKDFL